MSAEEESTTNVIHQIGKCVFGAVEFHATGQIFNSLWHCRACSWAASVSPVHLVGAETLSIRKGEEKLFVAKGLRTIIHALCSECMTIYQRPQAESFFAIFPPTFHIGGDDSIFQKLFDKYLPMMHTNYKNRS